MTLKKYPDFLIVGAAKSGTTSLHNYLSEHPDVILPEKQKETLFWHIISNPNKSQTKYLRNYIDNLEDYLNLFKNAKEGQICGEVTPSYLYYHDFVISNLKNLHPNWKNLKIVIILREPVSKVISHYHFVTNSVGIKDKSLKHALKLEKRRLQENKCLLDLFYIDSTKYYAQVKAYKDNFPNLKILLFEDLVKDSSQIMNELCSFLEIDENFEFENLGKKYNASTKRTLPKNQVLKIIYRIYQILPFKTAIRSFMPVKKIQNKLYKEEKIDNRTKKQLKEIFREDVLALQELTGIDLKSKWNY